MEEDYNKNKEEIILGLSSCIENASYMVKDYNQKFAGNSNSTGSSSSSSHSSNSSSHSASRATKSLENKI